MPGNPTEWHLTLLAVATIIHSGTEDTQGQLSKKYIYREHLSMNSRAECLNIGRQYSTKCEKGPQVSCHSHGTPVLFLRTKIAQGRENMQ